MEGRCCFHCRWPLSAPDRPHLSPQSMGASSGCPQPVGVPQWVAPVGVPSGWSQWAHPVGGASGCPQRMEPAGAPSGWRQWVPPVGGTSGRRPRVSPVGAPSECHRPWHSIYSTDGKMSLTLLPDCCLHNQQTADPHRILGCRDQLVVLSMLIFSAALFCFLQINAVEI